MFRLLSLFVVIEDPTDLWKVKKTRFQCFEQCRFQLLYESELPLPMLMRCSYFSTLISYRCFYQDDSGRVSLAADLPNPLYFLFIIELTTQDIATNLFSKLISPSFGVLSVSNTTSFVRWLTFFDFLSRFVHFSLTSHLETLQSLTSRRNVLLSSVQDSVMFEFSKCSLSCLALLQ